MTAYWSLLPYLIGWKLALSIHKYKNQAGYLLSVEKVSQIFALNTLEAWTSWAYEKATMKTQHASMKEFIYPLWNFQTSSQQNNFKWTTVEDRRSLWIKYIKWYEQHKQVKKMCTIETIYTHTYILHVEISVMLEETVQHY